MGLVAWLGLCPRGLWAAGFVSAADSNSVCHFPFNVPFFEWEPFVLGSLGLCHGGWLGAVMWCHSIHWVGLDRSMYALFWCHFGAVVES